MWADPPDINVLPEYGNDPRTVDNLLDGHNHTCETRRMLSARRTRRLAGTAEASSSLPPLPSRCDDLHAWLAPFTRGGAHVIGIRFDAPTTLSMIRVWNYNKSRIHSYRGARYVEMALDEQCIFKGEIRRATGTIQGRDPEQNSECILFTIDETTLQVCAMHPSARSPKP